MHIDDLLRAYQSLNDDTVLRRRRRLFAHQKKMMHHINQRIKVRDLVVRTVKPHVFGESDFESSKVRPNPEKRLLDHIASLMRLLNEDHRARLCDLSDTGQYHLKEDKRNHITRLSTPEFSLYTKKPLSLSEFESLVNEIAQRSEILEPNTHLLLSTFPVLSEDSTLLNMSIYIQGGSPPALRVFAKSSSTSVDVTYEEAIRNFSQSAHTTPSNQSEQIGKGTGSTVTTGSVFEVITEGGARYTQTIDVCRDHVEGHAKSQLMKKLESETYDTEVIPAQIEQCVTANSVMLVKDQCLARRALLVDPNMSMIDFYQAIPGEKVVDHHAMKRVLDGMPHAMRVGKRQAGYYVEHPPFGSAYLIDVLAERPVSTFKQDILPLVISHNERVLKRSQLEGPIHYKHDKAIDRMIELQLDHADLKTAILSTLKRLEVKMLQQCKPDMFESVFKTDEFHHKSDARMLIESRFHHLYQNIDKTDERFLFLIKPWQKDLMCRLEQLETVPGKKTVLSRLKATLKEGIETDLSVASDISFNNMNESDKPSLN